MRTHELDRIVLELEDTELTAARLRALVMLLVRDARLHERLTWRERVPREGVWAN